MAEEKKGKKKKLIIISIICVLIIVAVSSMISDEEVKRYEDNQSVTQKMAITFNGDYSEREIKDKITKVMNLYNVPINDENYSRSASVLISLRKEYNIDEMMILDYMIKQYSSKIIMTFPEAAGLAVTALKTGIN